MHFLQDISTKGGHQIWLDLWNGGYTSVKFQIKQSNEKKKKKDKENGDATHPEYTF
jgi:hypothetical protein